MRQEKREVVGKNEKDSSYEIKSRREVIFIGCFVIFLVTTLFDLPKVDHDPVVNTFWYSDFLVANGGAQASKAGRRLKLQH